jgi:hypothetical protein
MSVSRVLLTMPPTIGAAMRVMTLAPLRQAELQDERG